MQMPVAINFNSIDGKSALRLWLTTSFRDTMCRGTLETRAFSPAERATTYSRLSRSSTAVKPRHHRPRTSGDGADVFSRWVGVGVAYPATSGWAVSDAGRIIESGPGCRPIVPAGLGSLGSKWWPRKVTPSGSVKVFVVKGGTPQRLNLLLGDYQRRAHAAVMAITYRVGNPVAPRTTSTITTTRVASHFNEG